MIGCSGSHFSSERSVLKWYRGVALGIFCGLSVSCVKLRPRFDLMNAMFYLFTKMMFH
ncbi:hypothetical protein DAI22_02g333400 [Oryza sativa Japonica Group]|nr:hypothetical protein DAI22_02g333400 [Oryza sativa Japonica Group]